MNRAEYDKEYLNRFMVGALSLDPRVPLQIDGRNYTLLFNNLAAKGIYQEIGINLLDRDSLDEIRYLHKDLEKLTIFLYWGLKECHPEITKEQVDREVIVLKLIFYIMRQINQALNLFLPDMSDVKVEDNVGTTDYEDSRVSP